MRHSEGVRFMDSYSTGRETCRTSSHTAQQRHEGRIYKPSEKFVLRYELKDTKSMSYSYTSATCCCYYQVRFKSYGEGPVSAIPNVWTCPSYRVSPCVYELFGLLTRDLAELYDCLSLLVAGVSGVCKVFGFLHQSFQLSRHSLTGHTVQRVSQTFHFNLKHKHTTIWWDTKASDSWYTIYWLMSAFLILYWIFNCFNQFITIK